MRSGSKRATRTLQAASPRSRCTAATGSSASPHFADAAAARSRQRGYVEADDPPAARRLARCSTSRRPAAAAARPSGPPGRARAELLGAKALPERHAREAIRDHLNSPHGGDTIWGRPVSRARHARRAGLIVCAARNPGLLGDRATDSSPRPAAAAPSATDLYLAICAVYRDEGPYLREWIEFHRLVGVERFFLYNNRSTDDHREVLAPYVEEGVVAVTTGRCGPARSPAYDECLERPRDEARWIAFIDLDEFLFSPTGEPVAEILRRVTSVARGRAQLGGLRTSGHSTKPPGLVIESYTRAPATPGSTRHIKSIVDPVQSRGRGRARLPLRRSSGRGREPVSDHGWADEVGVSVVAPGQPLHDQVAGGVPGTIRANRPNPYGPRTRSSSGGRSIRSSWPCGRSSPERDEAILQYVPALRAALDLSPA